MNQSPRSVFAAVTRFACVLALLLISFGHNTMVSAIGGADVDLAAYTLPGDTVPDLCITGTSDDGNDKTGARHCVLCLISMGGILPEPSDDARNTAASRQIRFTAPAGDVISRVFFADAPPRGPPVYSV